MESNFRDEQFDFILVGGGCFGASTANELQKEWPSKSVGWFIGTHEHTASNDFLKIIRDAYPEAVMGEYANRAMKKWMSEEPFCHHFHHTSWIQAIARDTKETMNIGPDDRVVKPAEMMNLVGSTIEPELQPGEELYLNPDVGYADSALAVQALSQQAVGRGVKRYERNVTRLIVESGRCLGVEVDGSIVKADETIICTGAWTPGLLKKSHITFRPNFFQPSAVGVAFLPLSDLEFNLLKSMPILVAEGGTYYFINFSYS
jgi:sarcosine oxidase / L-pipecolate oxidase